jgi:hypothetical protein
MQIKGTTRSHISSIPVTLIMKSSNSLGWPGQRKMPSHAAGRKVDTQVKEVIQEYLVDSCNMQHYLE